jgi:hypothetical protein
MAKDEYALAIDKVRYIGDDVAAVVATSLDAVEEALSKIRVDYEKLPAVFDPMEAMKPGAPVLHEEIPNNVSATIKKEFGDEKAFGNRIFLRTPSKHRQLTTALSNLRQPWPWSTIRESNPLVNPSFFLRRNAHDTRCHKQSPDHRQRGEVRSNRPRQKTSAQPFFAMKTKKPVKFF